LADVTLPSLGESVTEGIVTRWLKNVGDVVLRDEPLLEISTDKVDSEMPSPAAGVLLKIVVPEGDTAAVGAVVAVIGELDGDALAAAKKEPMGRFNIVGYIAETKQFINLNHGKGKGLPESAAV